MSYAEYVKLDESLAATLEILRPEKSKYGFERKLLNRHVDALVSGLITTVFCPAIVAAKIKNSHIVIDGQHRLEAWRKVHFPVHVAFINCNTYDELINLFEVLNRKQMRVALSHVLKISQSEYAVKIRKLANKYGLSKKLSRVNSLLLGLTHPKRAHITTFTETTTPEQWRRADAILETWVSDKMWADKNSVYNSAGVLKAIAGVVKDLTDAAVTLRMLQQMDFSKKSELAKRLGTDLKAQQRMRECMYEFLMRFQSTPTTSPKPPATQTIPLEATCGS